MYKFDEYYFNIYKAVRLFNCAPSNGMGSVYVIDHVRREKKS